MRRTVIPELLDSDNGTPDEVRRSLADLRRINRWFGGIAATSSMLHRVAAALRQTELDMLEVASGSGDVPSGAARNLRRTGLKLRTTLLDRSASHLNGNSNAVVADALALPFRDRSFDIVNCALFLHHLEPDEVLVFAREALRVARVAVLINDLVRHPMHLALIYAGQPLFTRITRHDSVASVKRSYTPEEVKRMLTGVGSTIEISRHYLFRMGVILWK